MRDVTEPLLRKVEAGLRAGWSDGRIVPLLTRLGRRAELGSDAWLLAHRELATRIVADDDPRFGLPDQATLLSRNLSEAKAVIQPLVGSSRGVL